MGISNKLITIERDAKPVLEITLNVTIAQGNDSEMT